MSSSPPSSPYPARASSHTEEASLLKNLLIYRLLIVNIACLIGLGVAHLNGWVEKIVAGDTTGIIWVVVAFFVAFMISLTNRAFKISGYLNALKDGTVPRLSAAKVLEKGAHLDDMPGWIMLIGLLGNVMGIMLAIDSANLVGDNAKEAIVDLLGSMDVAFSATLASGVLGIWADINRRMLKTATVLMLADAGAKV